MTETINKTSETLHLRGWLRKEHLATIQELQSFAIRANAIGRPDLADAFDALVDRRRIPVHEPA